jgi:hypothetical protein
MLGIVNQLAADHVVAVDEDDGLVFCRDLNKRRVPMHVEIAKSQSPSSVQVVEIGLERNHDGCHRSSFGTGLGSGTPRIASNCCGVKP